MFKEKEQIPETESKEEREESGGQFLTKEEVEFFKRTDDSERLKIYLDNPKFRKIVHRGLIGLGKRFIGKNNDIARAYFERAGLPEEEINLRIQSPEAKKIMSLKEEIGQLKKQLYQVAVKDKMREDAKRLYEYMAEQVLLHKGSNKLTPEELAKINVDEAMTWLGCVGYSSRDAKEWLLSKNRDLLEKMQKIESKVDIKRCEENKKYLEILEKER